MLPRLAGSHFSFWLRFSCTAMTGTVSLPLPVSAAYWGEYRAVQHTPTTNMVKRTATRMKKSQGTVRLPSWTIMVPARRQTRQSQTEKTAGIKASAVTPKYSAHWASGFPYRATPRLFQPKPGISQPRPHSRHTHKAAPARAAEALGNMSPMAQAFQAARRSFAASFASGSGRASGRKNTPMTRAQRPGKRPP